MIVSMIVDYGKEIGYFINERKGLIMRAFIGIDLSNQLKYELEEYRQSFRNYAKKGRWRHIDNLHITLKFFSEISWEKKLELDKSVEEICSSTSAFSLRLDKVGMFSGRDVIRTLWMGVGGDLPALNSLYDGIEQEAKAMGFPLEGRKFKPHITLGQDIIFDRSFEEVKELAGDPKLPPIIVNKIYLFKSEQIGPRRVYTKVSEYNLQMKSGGGSPASLAL